MRVEEFVDLRPVTDYGQYARQLRALLLSVQNAGLTPHRASVASALDGQAASELRKLVSLDLRRNLGAFFTTSELRKKALESSHEETGSRVYFDPACGAGDLLVEAALRLPAAGSFEATVQDWGDKLLGSDIAPEFVEAARLRLLLAAAHRCGEAMPLNAPRDAFPGLVVGDGLAQRKMAERASHILVNPPFGYVKSPRGLGWAEGRVSAAAIFLTRLIELTPVGTSITAILPDVLRSGSRYAKWRTLVESRVSVSKVELHGRFDPSTDIDVFLLRGVRSDREPSQGDWANDNAEGDTVGDRFSVHVGPIVPHRDPKTGPWHPYIWPQRLPTSGTLDPAGKSRRFAGKTFDPPFVAIRRTSRPAQAGRARGVIVVGDRQVAVENHLLVALPKNGRMASCFELVEVLNSHNTLEWLDRRIRTRHLTVSAIGGIPWPDSVSHD